MKKTTTAPAPVSTPASSAVSSAVSSAAKLNLTRAQRQIHLLLEQSDQAMTAQAIYQTFKSRQQPIGLATVYRSLHSLQVKGLAQARDLTTGEWIYGLTSDDSHYLTCLNCGTSVPV